MSHSSTSYAFGKYSHLFARVTGLDSSISQTISLTKNADGNKQVREGGADIFLSAFYTWDGKHVTDNNSSNFLLSFNLGNGQTVTQSIGNTATTGAIMIGNKGTAINQTKAHKLKNGYIGFVEGGTYSSFDITLSFLDGLTTVFNSGGVGILHFVFEHRSSPLEQLSQLVGGIDHARLVYKNIQVSFLYAELTESNTRFEIPSFNHPTGCVADMYVDMIHTYDSVNPSNPDNAFIFLKIDQAVPHSVTNSAYTERIQFANLSTGTGQSIQHLAGKYTYLGYVDTRGLQGAFSGSIHDGAKSTILRSGGAVNMSFVLKYRKIMD